MSEPTKLGVDRTGMLERYHESQGLPPPEVSADAPAEAPAAGDTQIESPTDSQPADGKPVEAPAAAPVEKEVTVPNDKVEKDGKPILVPKAALDEEREKRKAKNLENRTLSENLAVAEKSRAELEQRVKELEAKVRGDVPGEDSEAVRQLAEENKKLKEANEKAEAERLKATETAAIADMAKKVAAADATLTKEGFPGFTDFKVDVYHAIAAKVKSGEIDEKDVTEATWLSVYKEVVFPAKKAIFEAQVKQDKLNAKNKLKQDANLSSGPGSAPESPEERDLDAPQTADGYMKFRKVLH